MSVPFPTLDIGARTTVIRLVGEFDIATVEGLNVAIDEQFARGRREIRFDVSGLTFCDCATLGAFARARHEALAREASVVLVGASAQLRRLLLLAHLHDTLVTADDGVGPHRLRVRSGGAAVPFGRVRRGVRVQTASLPAVPASQTNDSNRPGLGTT